MVRREKRTVVDSEAKPQRTRFHSPRRLKRRASERARVRPGHECERQRHSAFAAAATRSCCYFCARNLCSEVRLQSVDACVLGMLVGVSTRGHLDGSGSTMSFVRMRGRLGPALNYCRDYERNVESGYPLDDLGSMVVIPKMSYVFLSPLPFLNDFLTIFLWMVSKDPQKMSF